MTARPGDVAGDVLFLQGSSGLGGSKVSLLALVDVLNDSGIVPAVACPEPGWLTAELERRRIACVLLPFLAWRKWLERPRVAVTIRRRWLPALAGRRVALVHANESWWAPHAVLLGRALGVPAATHVRDGLYTLDKARQYRLHHADRVFAVSTELRERFAPDPGLHGKTRVLYNGHDEWTATGDERLRREGRAELALAPGEFAVGNAGRLCERKNQRLLVTALAEVKRRGRLPGGRVVLAGAADPPYEALLRAEVARLGLERDVLFAGLRPDLRRFYAAVDLVVHCATREGLPRVIPEAMLARRPVVATAAEGVRDAIPDARHGTVVAGQDAGALAGAIETMALDADRRAWVVDAAYGRARRLFSLEAHRRSVLEAYRELLPGLRWSAG